MTENRHIINTIKDLSEDAEVPKNVKQKLKEIIELLDSSGDDSIKINKVLEELDSIATDSNLQPFTRTQIYNIISLLESVPS